MQMSRLRSTTEGHRLGVGENGGLRDKLSNAQLLQQYQDLLRQNAQLKNIGNRLGVELKKLHTTFGTIPRPENVELYNAISSHPILHAIESTLTPLLETYELQCQNVQNAFENINDQFVQLEKKFRQSQESNTALRSKLTVAMAELVSLYEKGVSQQFGSDFTQMMMQQVNEKQKLLNEENIRLQRQYQRSKSEAQKSSKQLIQTKSNLRKSEYQGKLSKQRVQKLQKQNKYLTEEIAKLQDKISEKDAENKKNKWNLEKTESEIHRLNTINAGQQKNIRLLVSQIQNKQQKENATNRSYRQESKGYPLQSIQQNSEIHNKLSKYQREIQSFNKQRNKMSMQKETLLTKNQQIQKKCNDLKKLIEKTEDEKRELQRENAKSKKLLQKHIQKSKDDLQRTRLQYEDDKEKIQEDNFHVLEAKRQQIKNLQVKIEQQKQEIGSLSSLKQLYQIQKKDVQIGGQKSKEEKLSAQFQEKLKLAEQLCKQEIQITKNDYTFLREELQKVKKQLKQKNDELKRAREQIKQLSGVKDENDLIREKVMKIKNQYSQNLQSKEKQFDRKISQIKIAIEQSQIRRKKDKQKVQGASKEYRKILEQFRKTYEQRIRALESQRNNN